MEKTASSYVSLLQKVPSCWRWHLARETHVTEFRAVFFSLHRTQNTKIIFDKYFMSDTRQYRTNGLTQEFAGNSAELNRSAYSHRDNSRGRDSSNQQRKYIPPHLRGSRSNFDNYQDGPSDRDNSWASQSEQEFHSRSPKDFGRDPRDRERNWSSGVDQGRRY